VVPLALAERFFLIAFAALHPEWGNNPNLFSAALNQPPGDSLRFSFMQTLFQSARQSGSAFQIEHEHRRRAFAVRPLSGFPPSAKSFPPCAPL
jgi:hypothetical protein